MKIISLRRSFISPAKFLLDISSKPHKYLAWHNDTDTIRYDTWRCDRIMLSPKPAIEKWQKPCKLFLYRFSIFLFAASLCSVAELEMLKMATFNVATDIIIPEFARNICRFQQQSILWNIKKLFACTWSTTLLESYLRTFPINDDQRWSWRMFFFGSVNGYSAKLIWIFNENPHKKAQVDDTAFNVHIFDKSFALAKFKTPLTKLKWVFDCHALLHCSVETVKIDEMCLFVWFVSHC